MIPTDPASSSSEAMRHAMVLSQLRPNAVTDARVLAAMATTPREAYLPASVGDLAYRDAAVPIGHGRVQNPPMTTARLLTEARIRASDRVLLIGAAGGYTAAVLAEMAADVTAVESDPALLAIARDALRGNVTLIEGPLEAGHADGGPYDVLVIDGAVEQVPEALWRQLAVEGRAVAGVVDRGVIRLAAGRRSGNGFALEPFADLECAVLPGFAPVRSFTF